MGFSVASSESSTALSERVQSLRISPSGKRTPGGAGLPWTLCALLACTVAYLLFVGNPMKPVNVQSDSAASNSASAPKPANQAETSSSPGSAPAGEIALEAKGYIIPEQQILVSPQVSGRVIELNFDAGHHVEKDFVLAVLDNTEYLAEYDRINASVESSKQNFAELELGNRPDEKAQSKAELAATGRVRRAR